MSRKDLSTGFFARTGGLPALFIGLLLPAGLVPAPAQVLPSVAAPGAAAPLVMPTAAGRQGIVLMTVDSLRPDHLGCYHAGARPTPSIDAMAPAGIRFERAYTASVSTTPSAASMLTGLYPAGHGLRDDLGGRLNPGVVTLAERLRAAGWATAAVVGSARVDSDRGLDRGFDRYDDDIGGVRKLVVGLSPERRASEVAERGLAVLDALPAGRPFFLWLHFHDPHWDHDPAETWKKEIPDAPYDGEVATVDDAVGVVVRNVRARVPAGRLTFVLAGTHGEGLGDHGEIGHGFQLHDSTIRVPLIVVPEKGGPAGATEPAPVSLVDITPTLLALAGVAPAGALDGRPLAAVTAVAVGAGGRRRGEEARRIHVEAAAPYTNFGWSPLFAVIAGPRMVVQAQGGAIQAFDQAEAPAAAGSDRKVPRWARGLAAEGAARLGTLDPPEERRRAIREAIAGVVFPWDNSPFCAEKGSFPDPRDPERVALGSTLFEARIEAEQKIVGRSGKKGLQALDNDPANLTALEMVLLLGLKNRWGDMLLDTLEILTCNYPYRAEGYHYLGHFYSQKQDMARALEVFRLMALIDPANEEAEYDLACTLGALDRKDEAFEHLRRAIGLGAGDFEFMRRDPRLHALRPDPRFAEVIPAPGS